MALPVPNNAPTPAPGWGAASRYDFDNPAKWATVAAVPVLDEHTLTNQGGADVGEVGKPILDEIAYNNNKRVYQTGDPAPLIVGHTSDDPQAPEKPVQGYAVNYRVMPFKRDESGKTIYAIHVDYKVRKDREHIINDYPRRSVELWLGKRELDPIALLGGTTPERDLGLVIRNARLTHVSLERSIRPDEVGYTATSRKGGTVLRYAMDGKSGGLDLPAVQGVRYEQGGGKFGKVMHEFKHGTLHSGSKNGPKVTSRDQAKAIAASEAGISKKERGGDMSRPDDAMRYEDDGLDTGPPPEGEPDGDESMGGDDAMVQQIVQSKAFRQAIQDIVMEAIASAEGGGGGEPPMEGGMEGGMGGGAPPPPPEAGVGGPMGGGEPPPDEEAAHFHGEPPVRFDYAATGFGGPTSTFTSNFGGGSHAAHHGGHPPKGPHKMNRTPTRPQKGATQQNDEVVRLRRQVDGLVTRLARENAEKLVRTLKDEGILFGRTPEEEAKGEKAEVDFLAQLDEASRDYHVNNVIRAKYARRAPDPADPRMVGLAQYSRPDAGGGEGDEEYTPKNGVEAVEYADAIQRHGGDRVKATKYMRARGNGTARR